MFALSVHAPAAAPHTPSAFARASDHAVRATVTVAFPPAATNGSLSKPTKLLIGLAHPVCAHIMLDIIYTERLHHTPEQTNGEGPCRGGGGSAEALSPAVLPCVGWRGEQQERVASRAFTAVADGDADAEQCRGLVALAGGVGRRHNRVN